MEIYPCKKAYACLGGKIKNNSNDLCNVGHTGPLCDVCKKGFAKNEGKCFMCEETNHSRAAAITALVPMLVLAVLVFMIKTANPKRNQKEALSGVIKILMNYAQVFSLASSFEINWPDKLKELFERTKDFSSPRVSFYSSDCTFGWTYYDKLFVYLTMPLIYIGFSLLVIKIIACNYEKERKKEFDKINMELTSILDQSSEINEDIEKKYQINNQIEQIIIQEINKKYDSRLTELDIGLRLNNNIISEHIKEKNDLILHYPNRRVFSRAWTITTIVVGTFLMYPTIIKQSLATMGCKQYGDKYYLIDDLSIECYTPIYNFYRTICYLALVIYGIGIPTIGFAILFRYRYNLYDNKNRYEGAAPLSFLFLGYRNQVWYYEFIVMFKKVTLILISVFLKNFSRYQMITASLLMQIAFFLHVFLKPYDNISQYGILCNRLESMSLLALVVTLNSGLFFGTIESGYKLGVFETFLIVLLFVLNIFVFLQLIYHIYVLVIDTTVEKTKKITQKILMKEINADEYAEVNTEEKCDEENKNKEIDDLGINMENEDGDKVKIFVKNNCCATKIIGDERSRRLIRWSMTKREKDSHGIKLLNNFEKELFDNYHDEKVDFRDDIEEAFNNIKDKRKIKEMQISMNKIKWKIENIELDRYWDTVLANRIFIDLENQIESFLKKYYNQLIRVQRNEMIVKNRIDELKGIFLKYTRSGLNYDTNMNEMTNKSMKNLMNKIINMEFSKEKDNNKESANEEENVNNEENIKIPHVNNGIQMCRVNSIITKDGKVIPVVMGSSANLFSTINKDINGDINECINNKTVKSVLDDIIDDISNNEEVSNNDYL